MIKLRIPRQLEMLMRTSLMRSHSFAFERVGFVFVRLSRCAKSGWIVLATGYEPVLDEDYIDDPHVGARINSAAIRKAMQRALNSGEGVFHVHIHDHEGPTGPSFTDLRELRPVIQSVRNASPENAHGLLIFSRTGAWAEVLMPGSSQFQEIKNISVVGFPMDPLADGREGSGETDRFSRQTFLGSSAEKNISACHVGIVGLGGGGSHIAQQLAHIGFSQFSLFDFDAIEISNMNRLIGGTHSDASRKVPKVDVAARIIKGINPSAKISKFKFRWQDSPNQIRDCDVLFGCVDSFAERRDLEITARRYLIPFLDIGLDVHASGDEPPRMAGQVILSMPGELCMTCLGFLTVEKLAREAERYGAAGPRPQVVWANGVLASSAVGLAVDLITDWTKALRGPVYLSYDSNTNTVQPHKRLRYLTASVCPHFPISQLGEPSFKRL